MNALLPANARIAVVAPCGIYGEERFQAGLAMIRAAGYDPAPVGDLLQPHRYLAADDTIRAEHLIAALTAPEWQAVWVARGGYGLTRLLDRLPWQTLRARPLLGFSDVTALHTALVQRGLGPAVHAPVVHSLRDTSPASLRWLWTLLAGGALPAIPGQTWVHGEATGALVGGNLCLLAATCGTPNQLDTRGKILLLEEVGEPAYRVDRMLQQIKSAGLLDAIAGVALGTFTDCRAPADAGWSLDDVLREFVADLGVPVVAGLPIGHGPDNHAVVLGAPATLRDGALWLSPTPSIA